MVDREATLNKSKARVVQAVKYRAGATARKISAVIATRLQDVVCLSVYFVDAWGAGILE